MSWDTIVCRERAHDWLHQQAKSPQAAHLAKFMAEMRVPDDLHADFMLIAGSYPTPDPLYGLVGNHNDYGMANEGMELLTPATLLANLCLGQGLTQDFSIWLLDANLALQLLLLTERQWLDLDLRLDQIPESVIQTIVHEGHIFEWPVGHWAQKLWAKFPEALRGSRLDHSAKPVIEGISSEPEFERILMSHAAREGRADGEPVVSVTADQVNAYMKQTGLPAHLAARKVFLMISEHGILPVDVLTLLIEQGLDLSGLPFSLESTGHVELYWISSKRFAEGRYLNAAACVALNALLVLQYGEEQSLVSQFDGINHPFTTAAINQLLTLRPELMREVSSEKKRAKLMNALGI